VIEGIADHVKNGIPELIDDIAIHLNLAARYCKMRFFPQLLREITHQPGEPLRQCLAGHHRHFPGILQQPVQL